MLVYKATEKDCVGEDGEVAECVICFEEFEPGDEMGRLECLCRFHRVSSFVLPSIPYSKLTNAPGLYQEVVGDERHGQLSDTSAA